MSSPFPPKGSAPRSVLVTNISTRASETTIEEFFSFCGSISDKRIKLIPPTSTSTTGADAPTLEAFVIFETESARQSALLLDGSTILDQRVSIVPGSESWREKSDPPHTNGLTPGSQDGARQEGLFSFLPAPAAGALSATAAGLGGLFGDMGHVLGEEAQKAGNAWKESNDHGVLKKVRDQATAATEKTKEAASGIDQRFGVKDKVLTAASVGKTKAQEVAEVVTTHTKSVATTVDAKLHVSDKATQIASKAMENDMVANGYNSIVQGWSTLWKKTESDAVANGTERESATSPVEPAPQEESPSQANEPRS